MSHPMWVRGLKRNITQLQKDLAVAPYVGAWIETIEAQIAEQEKKVAPYVGAWIETINSEERLRSICRTLCGCVD